MKNKFDSFKSKKYLLLFALVMVLNIALTVVLLRVSFGQTKRDDFSSQQPVKVEVMEQKNNPLRITVVTVDNSALSHQEVIFSLQNLDRKAVRAYTLLGSSKSSGKIITGFFAAKLFKAEEPVINSLPIERQNIKEDEPVILSIDYVEFEDGSSWGTDSRGKSMEINGEIEGVKTAIRQLKDLIKNQSADSLAALLKQETQEITVDVPDINQSEEWKKGFRMGYRTVISILQRVDKQTTENLARRLDELEKVANEGGIQ
ncbi:MAG TPA: hypothetical protein VGC76_06575 [Pyrinomonadaceae bacterium]|jgi:hypothetical protein